MTETNDSPGQGDPHHEHINTEGHASHHLHDADGENQAWFTNRKRTYDAYQQADLDNSRNVQNVALQALQNAVTTADMVAKQAVAHRDIAVNKQWNINETDLIAANAITAGGSINAAIAKHVQENHPA